MPALPVPVSASATVPAAAPSAAGATTVAPVTVQPRAASSVCPPDAGDYRCLNDQLARSAKAAHDQAPPAQGVAPASVATGQPDASGLYSRAGVQEQYGSNFGKSAYPQRPAPPVYAAPASASPRR